MRGCRHSGVRVIIPPNSAQMPMRITCRYLRRERLIHPPPLMEGEACASKIMEVGPAGAKFLTPVLIEVPHFASLRGKEREIIILRSDSGEVWREHLFETDQKMVDSIIRSAGEDQLSDQKENSTTAGDGGGGGEGDKKRLTRIVTNEFPQYFAIISRVRQEVHPVGPDGSTVDSQVVDRVQAIFTEGALTKRIKIGLQVRISLSLSLSLIDDICFFRRRLLLLCVLPIYFSPLGVHILPSSALHRCRIPHSSSSRTTMHTLLHSLFSNLTTQKHTHTNTNTHDLN